LDSELDGGLELSFCPNFGYLNVKPKDTGLGLKMNLKFEIKANLLDLFRVNLDKFHSKKDLYFVIKRL
jgi:protein-arginine kinase